MSSGNHVFLVRNLTLIQATIDGKQEQQKSAKGIKDAPQWSSTDLGSYTSCHWGCASFYYHCLVLSRFFYPWDFGWCVHPPHMASHFWPQTRPWGIANLLQDYRLVSKSWKEMAKTNLVWQPFVWPKLMWQLLLCQHRGLDRTKFHDIWYLAPFHCGIDPCWVWMEGVWPFAFHIHTTTEVGKECSR